MTKRRSKVRILNCGDRGILLEFGTGISPKINQRIQSFFCLIQESRILGIVEAVPCFRSLLICYDPLLIDVNVLKKEIRRIEEKIEERSSRRGKKVTIPVVYGGEFGPDLDFVAQFHGMEKEEVMELHQKPEYLLYMYGFAPGFGLLGGLPRSLVTPRLKTPRLKVPAGSVGIGSAQTGVYPFESPGGWQLIGRTPLKLYDPSREVPVILNLGDTVKFRRIDEEQYHQIVRRLEMGQEDINRYFEA